VAFSPDGKTILTAGDEAAQLWDVPAMLPDDPPRLSAWMEILTGLELDEQGSIRVLDSTAWRGRRDRLEQLGGPPPTEAPRRLDPIVFGPDPTARARAYSERTRWSEAEAAFTEAVRERPYNRTVWEERGRFYLARSQPASAAASYGEAVSLLPDAIDLRHSLILSRLAAGDAHGLRKAISDLLDRYGSTPDPLLMNNTVWDCVLVPSSATDSATLVRLAEGALKGYPGPRHEVLNTLGGALYRAGRLEEAIRRLRDGIRFTHGTSTTSTPQDWAFLAMAHFRLGHRDEARRWIDRFRDRQPVGDAGRFWDELEIRLLRSEAEAVVLHDPAFPADPFAK
jgi:tetratricopeptide (TPR) repeat protein